MKVVRLQSNNILRLTAVDITPDGNLITIGGRNGAGKSSVLNSIAMALGGAKMAPEEPIRIGQTDAKVTIDLGDLIVTRRFTRDRLHQDGCAALESGTCNCTPEYTETRSTLSITNKDGANYPSPQALLDKLMGRLTFDPLAFASMDSKLQDETLRKIVNLDVKPIEQLRRTAFDARASVRKVYESRKVLTDALPSYDGAPETEISIGEVSQRMLEAEHLRKAADEAGRQSDAILAKWEAAREVVFRYDEKIADLTRQLEESQRARKIAVEHRDSTLSSLDAASLARDRAYQAIPDVTEIQQQLADIEATNTKIRANKAKRDALAQVQTLLDQIEEYDGDIAAADEAKRVALESVLTLMPVPGLGLSDGGVTFGGVPFKQASTSEQLRVSVAIGLALNPDLKVLLIRNGNLLDEDSLKAVAEQAEKAEAQVWMEYVTKDAKQVQVMIEDGHTV